MIISALAKKWKYYDKDNSGTISKKEIATVIARVYLHLEEEARKKMIEDAAKELMGELDLNSKLVEILVVYSIAGHDI